MLRNGKRIARGGLHPCAGITLIRFYGFVLSTPALRQGAPRESVQPFHPDPATAQR
jgi:hypothetical protein